LDGPDFFDWWHEIWGPQKAGGHAPGIEEVGQYDRQVMFALLQLGAREGPYRHGGVGRGNDSENALGDLKVKVASVLSWYMVCACQRSRGVGMQCSVLLITVSVFATLTVMGGLVVIVKCSIIV